MKTFRNCDRAKGAPRWTHPTHAQTTTPKDSDEVSSTTRRMQETGKTKEDMETDVSRRPEECQCPMGRCGELGHGSNTLEDTCCPMCPAQDLMMMLGVYP
ncbi:hypothetical protein R3I94_000560 [Phoxinus phoxinus]